DVSQKSRMLEAPSADKDNPVVSTSSARNLPVQRSASEAAAAGIAVMAAAEDARAAASAKATLPTTSHGVRQPPNGILAIVGIATLLIIVAGLAWWKMFGVSLPPASADAVTLAKFVNTSRFSHLSDKRRRPYLRTLRVKADDVADAFLARRLTKAEYEQAYFCGWMDRQIDHMHNFFRQPPGKREQYLRDEHIAKLKSAKPPKAPLPPHEAEVQFVEKWKRGWDADKRAEWDEFRQASKRVKQALATTTSSA